MLKPVAAETELHIAYLVDHGPGSSSSSSEATGSSSSSSSWSSRSWFGHQLEGARTSALAASALPLPRRPRRPHALRGALAPWRWRIKEWGRGVGSSWYCNPAPRASSFVQQILKKPPHHTLCYLTLLTKDLCPFTICYCETPCRASCKLLQHTIHAMAAFTLWHQSSSTPSYNVRTGW